MLKFYNEYKEYHHCGIVDGIKYFPQGTFSLVESELQSCSLYFLRLCYVQSLAGHKSPVTAVSASETTGDIATVCDSGIFGS